MSALPYPSCKDVHFQTARVMPKCFSGTSRIDSLTSMVLVSQALISLPVNYICNYKRNHLHWIVSVLQKSWLVQSTLTWKSKQMNCPCFRVFDDGPKKQIPTISNAISVAMCQTQLHKWLGLRITMITHRPKVSVALFLLSMTRMMRLGIVLVVLHQAANSNTRTRNLNMLPEKYKPFESICHFII